MNAAERIAILVLQLLVLLCLPLASGCDQSRDRAQQRVAVAVLTYQEQEAGVQAYPLRILVNERYLRFDDGYDASDYMLMERATRTIYSVNHADRSILVIVGHAPVDPPPADLLLTEERQEDTGAPPIAGRQPVHMRFLANGEVCYQAVVVPGLLQEAGAALAEYAVALGNRQFSDLESVPGEMRTPCFLSRYVYAPARHLQPGLPVQEWDETGYRRMLVDFREDQLQDAILFTLPVDYEQFRPGE